MSNWIYNLNDELEIISFWINRIIPPIEILLGTFGNMLNIIIFSRRCLRRNPCSIYFLISSFNNIFSIYIGLLTRYLSTSWNKDPSLTNNILCKLRIYFVYSCLSCVLWYTVLASIDRYLSSSHNAKLRGLSKLRIAQKIIIFSTIFIYLIHIHILIYYESRQNNCNSSSNIYSIFFNIFFFIISCTIPIILMIIFGLLTIINVQKSRKRLMRQINNIENQRLKSNDRQLILMVLFQILITIIISTPYSFINLYYIISINILKYRLQLFNQIILSFLLDISRVLYFCNPIIGFFIYTLTGKKFRDELKRCILYGFKYIFIRFGLFKYIPRRIQQRIFIQNQTILENQSLTQIRKTNKINPLQN